MQNNYVNNERIWLLKMQHNSLPKGKYICCFSYQDDDMDVYAPVSIGNGIYMFTRKEVERLSRLNNWQVQDTDKMDLDESMLILEEKRPDYKQLILLVLNVFDDFAQFLKIDRSSLDLRVIGGAVMHLTFSHDTTAIPNYDEFKINYKKLVEIFLCHIV